MTIYLKCRAVACAAILCAAALFPSGRLFAQAPPGPMTPSQPLPPAQPAPQTKKEATVEARKTLAGFWKLNADESDDPRKKMQEARQTNGGAGGGSGRGGPGGGGGRVGIGFPFPGGGGNGPYGGGGGGRGGEDNANSQQLQELVRPASSQTIALQDAEVDSTNDHGDKLAFYTDGRKIQKSKNSNLLEIAAHWDGGQLVTDEKSPQGRKMSRTFELSPDGRQFYEIWRIENSRSGSVIVIRYVYDAAAENRR